MAANLTQLCRLLYIICLLHSAHIGGSDCSQLPSYGVPSLSVVMCGDLDLDPVRVRELLDEDMGPTRETESGSQVKGLKGKPEFKSS